MASPVVEGPVQWFTNTGVEKAWEYLGMCEGDVVVDLSPSYEGLGLDGSAANDYDRQLMAVSGVVSGDLSYWSEPTLDNLKCFLNDPTATPGQFANGTFGTLLRTEDVAFSLIITSQYATKDAYKNAGVHPLMYFPLVFPMPMRRNKGTKASRERVAFECVTKINGLGGGVLYYNSITFTLPTPS